MSVRLISVTPEPEAVILYCARASSDQQNTNTGLIKYLIRNKHWSPFEMSHMVFEIITSRTIAHQILRHRSFSFQEFSQRYAKPDGTVKYRARRQADKNRQSSIDDLSENTIRWFDGTQSRIEEICFHEYERALTMGISKESARFLLPEAVQTRLYMSGSVRSWIHYFYLRCDEHTQEEHRELALEMRKLLAPVLPTIAEALEW